MMTGSSELAVRATQKLLRDDDLLVNYGGENLKGELDNIPLWRGPHVRVQQRIEDFASYIYLPKLQGPQRLILEAVGDGVEFISWESTTFAYAGAFDEGTGRYQGDLAGRLGSIGMNGLAVKGSVIRAQHERDEDTVRARGVTVPGRWAPAGSGGVTATVDGAIPVPVTEIQPRRFHGSVELDPLSVGPQASKIAAEVVSHLSALVGAEVTITLDIEAQMPDGATTHVVKTVTENAQQLKFQSRGFERD